MEKEANKVVFLIDDDADDKEILIAAIHQINPGIMMEVFENGRDFMNRVDMDNCPDRPSLVILDYNMPYYSGAEVLKNLQDHHRLQGIPKIIWSTASDYITRNECISNGATDYYEKPYNYSAYCQLAANMLEYIT